MSLLRDQAQAEIREALETAHMRWVAARLDEPRDRIVVRPPTPAPPRLIEMVGCAAALELFGGAGAV